MDPSTQRPFRVGLFIGVSPEMGGVYQYSLALLDAFLALPETYEKVIVYTHPSWAERLGGTPGVQIDERVARRSLAMGTLWTLSCLSMDWWKRLAGAVDPVARRLKELQCDVWFFTAHSFVCTQMPVRAIGTVQDLMHRYERQFKRDTPWYTFYWRERVFSNIAHHAAGALVDSELGRQQFVESFGADPERVYPLPFIAPRYTALPTPEDFDSRHDLPEKFLFYPAQFWEHKNHARLLRALGCVRRDCPDVQLVLAGGKRLGFEACRKQAGSLGLEDAVTFLGYVPDEDLVELYRRARALIYPTFYGPTNIPPLEAFFLGCPVAASGIYAMPEQLGDAALLFDPGDELVIADAMRRLWTDDGLCATLAERGRERARENGQQHFDARFASIVGDILDAGDSQAS